MNILLAGGTGFLGSNLALQLKSAGHTVYYLSRKSKNNEFYYYWNPSKNEIDLAALIDKDIIINLSGASIAGKRWTKKYKKTIHYSRLQTTHLLVNAALNLEKPPQLFINSSAIGYYGSRPGRELTENSEQGSDFLASVCCNWEKETELLSQKQIPLAIFRTGIVLGNGGGSLPKLQLPLKLGMNVLFGTGKQKISWIHIADFTRIIEQIVNQKLPAGIYNMVSPSPVSQRTLNSAILRSLGRKALKIKIPANLVKLLFGEMAALFLSDQFVVPKTLSKNKYEFIFKDIDAALENLNE